MIDALKEHYLHAKVDTVIGIEARGFIFGPALAYALGTGFIPVRKPREARPAEIVKSANTSLNTASIAWRSIRTRSNAGRTC